MKDNMLESILEPHNSITKNILKKFKNSLFILLTASIPYSTYYAIETKTYDLKQNKPIHEIINTKELQDWIKGPVRYIASFDDETNYKQLKTDNKRLDFIYDFWKKKDPTPLTLKNEFRLEFWDRVKTTNALFNESTKPGWKTDRGKIYILFGPPDDVEHLDPRYESIQKAKESSNLGGERWIYHRGKEFKVDPTLVVPFIKDASGEYRLSGNPKHYSKSRPDLKLDSGFSNSTIDKIEEMIAFNEMWQARFDLGQAIDIASGEKVLREIIETVEYYEPIKTEPKLNYFQANNNKDYILLSLDVNLNDFYKGEILNNQPIPIAMFGKLISDDKTEYLFSTDDYAPRHIIKEGNKARIMAPILAPPGDYTLVGGIQEMVSGRISSFQNKINVPSIEDSDFKITNLTFASKIEDKLNASILPYSKNITPKLSNEFYKNEDFNVYYQLLGLSINNQENKDFDITYKFYVKHNDSLIEIGKPILLQNRNLDEQGYSFTLEKWPPGEYTLNIDIKDNISGKETSYLTTFKVKQD